MRIASFLVLLLGVGCTAEEKPTAEVCDNLEDDDADGHIDCADDDCAKTCTEVCTDDDDNDDDGLIDCADPDCDGTCPERCDDGRDNDADGRVDCEDEDCFSVCPEICDDGRDNDADGLTDCIDPDCVVDTCVEVCTDGRDNDADGRVDCEDLDCAHPTCPEVCTDGRDNDDDGRIDCEDPDCDGACIEVCDDRRDNDADGRVDCEDPECRLSCDADDDGFVSDALGGDDCDDTQAEVNPSRSEICNGDAPRDDDCNGLVDMDDPGLDPASLVGFYPDDDDDDFGGNVAVRFLCQGPEGWVDNNRDCDDSDPAVNPLMEEICNPDEPRDDDCDGRVDDDDPDVTPDSFLIWFIDSDGDSWGREDDPVEACARPPGTTSNDLDCDDTDPTIGPPTHWLEDPDGDGFGDGDPLGEEISCSPPEDGLAPEWVGLDCSEGNPDVYPGAIEICEDDIDQDCDGLDLPCTSYLFTVRVDDDVLVRFDTDTFDLVDIGPLGADFDFGEVAWDPVREVMWMVDGRPRQALYTVDVRTGSATLVGIHGVTDLFGLAIDPISGVLYGSTRLPTGWYTLDPITAEATFVGDPEGVMDGLDYDTVRDTFITLAGGTGDLSSVDATTGALTLLSSEGWLNNCGLAADAVTNRYYAVDWSGVLYTYDPDADYARTVIRTGIGAHDGLTVGPPP